VSAPDTPGVAGILVTLAAIERAPRAIDPGSRTPSLLLASVAAEMVSEQNSIF
jgi:hypothetical protein